MESQLLPLGRATGSEIRTVTESGLVLPVRQRDEKLLLTNADGQMLAIMLTGRFAFSYFPVDLKTPHFGIFLPDVEILVDFTSAIMNPPTDMRGALVLDQNSLGLVASRVGPGFYDPHPIRLWTQVEKGSDSGNVVFGRWGVALRDGDQRVILFEHDIDAKVQD